MGMVRSTATENDLLLSEEAIAELAALEGRPIDTSDIPELTPRELQEAARKAREKRKKRMFSLRLPAATIQWWQSLGEGYTGVMARLLEEAWRHPDWIKLCLQDNSGIASKTESLISRPRLEQPSLRSGRTKP